MEPDETKCSHCGAENSVGEYIDHFHCDECEWWGYRADKLEFSPDDEMPPAKAPPPRF